MPLFIRVWKSFEKVINDTCDSLEICPVTPKIMLYILYLHVAQATKLCPCSDDEPQVCAVCNVHGEKFKWCRFFQDFAPSIKLFVSVFVCVFRLEEILEAANDMAVDIPQIWLHLAEIITPVLHDGGIPMGVLFR